ncbi:MAG: ABC transporter permease [Gammaproteobacteria bacterium]|nr:FtsX-like permease family protein [Rhodocyclaceae bacterium]MBU3908264.1 ABC transporter permease [Gammaproteobacteria bacterium]MBU3989933.1 ABC transporter permease [Gammaproteobacteria bacterium]MBU4003099.1 ABC transporter permease [Gammaproteobacteria bacterium]MBU4019941.1 ABC transporter permease [Gammaproteobacteria bacterium]
MNFYATLLIALKALRVNLLRSALTMLGIIIGVAAVIIMIAVGSGAQEKVESQIKSLGANLLIVFSASTSHGGARSAAGATHTISEDDAYAIARELPDYLVGAAPALRGSGQIVAGNSNWSSTFYGITPDYFEVRAWTLADGRYFDPAEINGAAKVAIIGQTVATSLFGDESPIDQVIRIRNVPLTVIGVLASKGQSLSGNDQDDVVLMPISTARNRVLGATVLAKSRSVGSISIKARDGVDLKIAEEKIRDLLRQRHRLQPGQDDDFNLRNLTEILQAREDSSRVMAMLLAAVASVSLLVGGIGIMNIMLVSVTERTREIGLRRAVGAKSGDILRQFLIEAITLSLIGGLIGVLLGSLGAELIGELAGWPIRLSPFATALAVSFAAGIGIFFGYYPARQAARLSPIEALRHE